MWISGNRRTTHPPSNKIPAQTIVIAPNHIPENPWGHLGGRGNQPAMPVCGRFTVTNLTSTPILLSGVEIRRHFSTWKGPILIKDPHSSYVGSHPIQPNSFRETQFLLFITPPFKKKGYPFKATIVITDQFGNRHLLKNQYFTSAEISADNSSDSVTTTRTGFRVGGDSEEAEAERSLEAER